MSENGGYLNSPDYWWEEDGGLTANDAMRHIRAEALAKIPEADAERIADEVYFLVEENSAQYVPQEVLGGRAVVTFSGGLLHGDQDQENEAVITCLHECAHHICGHESPMLKTMQPLDYHQQELEAWLLVSHWLNEPVDSALERFIKYNPAFPPEMPGSRSGQSGPSERISE